MLDAAALFQNRVPDIVAVLRLVDEQRFEMRVADREAARQRLVRVDVRRDRLDARAGAAADDRNRRGRRDRHLAAETLHHPLIGGVGAGAAFLGEQHRRLIDLRADMLEDAQVRRFRHRALEGQAARLEEAVEAHHAKADRAFAAGAVFGARHFGRGAVDIVLQDIVEHAHHVFDEALVAVPLVPGFEVERREAADRGAIIAEMVAAGGQRDFRAEVRGGDLEAQIAVMLGHHAVHLVDEDDVGLTRREARFDELLEQRARVDAAADALVLGAAQVELGAVADGFHELVGDQHAVVEVERLAVEVARRFADFEELLDLRVADVEIAGGRTAAQAALRDGEGERVHHADEGNDAAGLAVEADGFADAAHAAPIGADAAAAAGEPDILVPRLDNTLKAVGDRVEITADRQTAAGAAVRQHGGGGHEPQPRDIIIEALRMLLIVGIGRRDAREEILI